MKTEPHADEVAAPTRTLALDGNRTLAFALYGARDGRPLYVFHGFPGSRLQASLVHEQALAAGVQLIAIDRPGFGESTPAPSRSLLDWPGDVAAVADRLGHRRFGVLGISCGGPYALACAHGMPGRIDYAGLMAGIGPMDIPAIRREQLPILTVMFALARVQPVLISPLLLLDRLLFRRNASKAVDALARMMTPPDRQLLAANPVVRARFAESLAEAYRQGIAGAMREAQLIAQPWGFRLEDITLPVHVHQGGIDRNVPTAMGRHIADHLPQGRFHFHPDDGHLSILVSRFALAARHFLKTPASDADSGRFPAAHRHLQRRRIAVHCDAMPQHHHQLSLKGAKA